MVLLSRRSAPVPVQERVGISDIERMKKKTTVILILAVGVLWYVGSSFLTGKKVVTVFDSVTEKRVEFLVNGIDMGLVVTQAETVGDFFREHHITIGDGDVVAPAMDEKVRPGERVRYDQARHFTVSADGKTSDGKTVLVTVEEVLRDAGVTLDEDDIVKPARETVVTDGTKIVVTRVVIKEETVDKPIAFDTVTNNDGALSWRKTVVIEKGENGVRTYRYRVSYYDGKEVARHPLGSEVTKNPVKAIVTQGTFVQVGKAHTGGASWYSFTGTMSAANPWLPMGSYVRVTNLDNGKTVIVKINDRGPFVGGRIIDLDKVAFQKIASIGAGVINVKMEEITN